jgi:hypothetical protein
MMVIVLRMWESGKISDVSMTTIGTHRKLLTSKHIGYGMDVRQIDDLETVIKVLYSMP